MRSDAHYYRTLRRRKAAIMGLEQFCERLRPYVAHVFTNPHGKRPWHLWEDREAA